MSCPTNIDHATTTGPMPPGLIARQASRWTGAGPCRRAEISSAAGYPDNIARNGLPDSVNTDPAHVWGDEGPVNG
jgi:hypothetical protein